MIIEASKNKSGFNIIQIIDVIQTLSHSQGFYGRLLEQILVLKENEPEKFEELKDILEGQNFQDSLDVVMYFEG